MNRHMGLDVPLGGVGNPSPLGKAPRDSLPHNPSAEYSTPQLNHDFHEHDLLRPETSCVVRGAFGDHRVGVVSKMESGARVRADFGFLFS